MILLSQDNSLEAKEKFMISDLLSQEKFSSYMRKIFLGQKKKAKRICFLQIREYISSVAKKISYSQKVINWKNNKSKIYRECILNCKLWA